ncbi:MAG: AbrB/MazE/SpoVT family DNA-binding domain-containing protein [Alphaproteobacteria bacterium]|nr:AbrB/MazE/SpoVT family DNA-binding domain-containing protein [Alphaproteobacteria bacterium]
MKAYAKIGSHGRLVIPAELRAAVGLKEGDQVLIEIRDGDLRIRNYERTVRWVQETVAKYVPRDVSLVDELIAERREEAKREDGE